MVPSQSPGAPAPTLTPPFLLGQYRVVEQIGQGGMGSVYRALHPFLKKEFAIKLLRIEATSDARAVARFRREMEAIGRLDHHHIVRATDAGEAGGVHFLVMELVDGIDLSRLVRLRGPLPLAEACEVIRQAAAGLQCAHEHGLVHRDIKPSNLVLSRQGEVKVLDLGLALLGSAGPGSRELTATGQVMGTADYMAPEQWERSNTVDIRADIYSLGCTLYTLLVGRPPFSGEEFATPLRKMAAHAQAPVAPLASQRADVPAALEELLGQMTAKSPDDRPDTPANVIRALEPFAQGANLSALIAQALVSRDPPGPHERPTLLESGRLATPSPDAAMGRTRSAAPPPHAGRNVSALGIAAILSLSVVVATGFWLWTRSPTTATTAGADSRRANPEGWQYLLATKPGQRLWPNAISSSLQYDAGNQVLSFSTSSTALIPLGVTEAGSYKLQVGFHQPRWVGDIGVYFGGKEGPEPDTFHFQFIDMRPQQPHDYRFFNLVRSVGTIQRPAGKPLVPTTSFATAPLPDALDSAEKLLEIVVKPGGLDRVRWDGRDCPQLTTDNAKVLAAGAGARGEFGIYCSASSATVLTARFHSND